MKRWAEPAICFLAAEAIFLGLMLIWPPASCPFSKVVTFGRCPDAMAISYAYAGIAFVTVAGAYFALFFWRQKRRRS